MTNLRVYSVEILLMMDSGHVRNMQSTLSNKSEKQCISLAFIIRIHHDARSCECQIYSFIYEYFLCYGPCHEFRSPLPTAKQPGRKADRSPPSSVEVKTAWSYASTAPNSYVALLIVKNSDEFIFLLAHIVGFVRTFK